MWPLSKVLQFCALFYTCLLTLHAQNLEPLPEPEVNSLLSLDEASRTLTPIDDSTPVLTAPLSVVQHSLSANKWFQIHGSDLNTRSKFSLRADEKTEILGRLLKDNSPPETLIIVTINEPNQASRRGKSVQSVVTELAHGGFHFQINVQLRQGFRMTEFDEEVVRILLAERTLRNHKHLRSTRTEIMPEWLLKGIYQALDYRERNRPSALFSAVFKSGRVYTVDGLLQANYHQLDAISRGIYETSCCALIMTLLEQNDGGVRFKQFLNALATDSRPERDILLHHFPQLNISDNSLEKWWSLQMATMANPTSMETLNVKETERQLDLALEWVFYQKPPTPKPEILAAPSTEILDPATEATETPSRSRFQFWKGKQKDIKFFLKKKEELPDSEYPAELPLPEESMQLEVEEAQPSKGFKGFSWFKRENKNLSEEEVDENIPYFPYPEDSAAQKPRTVVQSRTLQQKRPLTEYQEIMQRADRQKIIRSNIDRLNTLKTRAHPLYRPLIGDYTKVMEQLFLGKDKGVAERLKILHQHRQFVYEQASAVESHVDWYQATFTSGVSDTFDDYLKLCEEIEQETLPRTDAISKYLDALDREYR